MRILSLDGGGYLGLSTAAFLQSCEKYFGTTTHESFDLFCGTSTGAIIALGLAYGLSANEIVDLYQQLGSSVFKQSPLSNLKQIFFAKYSSKTLKESLYKVFEDSTLADIESKGKKVMITSFCLSKGRPTIFKTDHSQRLNLHNAYKIADIALSSSAAPSYFPIVKLFDTHGDVPHYYCDGGVFSNSPALLGFVEAISELQQKPADIKLLSISTPRVDLKKNQYTVLNHGLIGWARTLSTLFIDSNSIIMDEALRRIVRAYGQEKPIYERIELSNTEKIPFDSVTQRYTEILKGEGRTKAETKEVREILAPFFK